MEDPSRRIAYHESGHAVIAWLELRYLCRCGCPILKVSASPASDSMARVELCDCLKGAINASGDEKVLAAARNLYAAGPAAETVWVGDYRKDRGARDEYAIWRLWCAFDARHPDERLVWVNKSIDTMVERFSTDSQLQQAVERLAIDLIANTEVTLEAVERACSGI